MSIPSDSRFPLTPQARDNLISSLREALATIEAIAPLLAKERESILGQDMDALAAAMEEKAPLLDRIHELDKRIASLAPEGKVSPVAHGDAELSIALEALITAASSLASENQANAALVHTRLSQVAATQRALRSAFGAETGTEYRPGGILKADGNRTFLGAG